MRRCLGFTYLTALFIVAFMGVGSMAVGTVWHTASLREKEAQLLFVGHQYRLAIARYYLTGPQRQYPRKLEDLLKDPRQPTTQRYLRQLYADPITASNDWGIVKAPDGGVMGVYSRSEDAPLKTANFKFRDRDLEGAQKYADWKFMFGPAASGQFAPNTRLNINADGGAPPAPAPPTRTPPGTVIAPSPSAPAK